MKTTISLLLLLGSGAVALAQDPAAQAGTNAQAGRVAAPDPQVTGHAITYDPTGRTVIVMSRQASPTPRDHRAGFDALDGDGDGSLSRSEASADKYLARAFAHYDSDRDDRLSFEEARRWLER